MPFSIRLDKKTESLLNQTASELKTSKAEVIKKSVIDYCSRVLKEKRKRPYEIIKDLLCSEGSGRGDLSERGEDILRERFRRKT